MQKLFIFLFLFSAAFVQAQDLTGVWRGHFRSNSGYERLTGDDDRYKIEVQIAQRNNSFEAVTYSYLNSVFYGKAEADGSLNTQSQKVLLRELKIVELRSFGGDACIMTYFLKYSKLGGEEFLEGTFTGMSVRDSSSCGFLYRTFLIQTRKGKRN
jgi:hypothetical protein